MTSRHPAARASRKPRRSLLEPLETRALLTTSTLVYPGADGHLVYTPNAAGDVIPNFSQVGYETGDTPFPNTPGGATVQVAITLNPGTGDMTATIQNAINTVAGMPLVNGFRGAILLTAGNYPISGTLNINSSGIILEGQGNDPNTGTRLEATGTSQRFLINIAGSGSMSTVANTTHNVTDTYVPVGATSFDVDSTANLAVGETVIVSRPSTQAWINAIGANLLADPWTPGSKDLDSDRVITAINGNTITIDAPLTNSLEAQYGGGTIYRYTWSGRISQVGLMNMYTYSDSASPSDGNHATGVLTMDSVQNAWVDNLSADNFALNVVEIGGGAKWVTFDNDTIENTSQTTGNIADAPAGIGNSGQEILVENTNFANAFHAIAIGASVPGPNVYANITITDPDELALNLSHSRDESGPHQRWSTGGLFDNYNDADWLNIRNAANEGSGHGWQGANYVIWNSTDHGNDVSSPPTAQNWVIGSKSATTEGTAIYQDTGTTVTPQSLYAAQILDRNTPTVASGAVATPSPISGKTTALTALGADAAGESVLTYTWSVTSAPAGAPTVQFSMGNGANAGKSTTATFGKAGAYTLLVTIQYPGGFSATSSVSVTVNQTLTSIGVSPATPQVGLGGTQQFSALPLDQFNNPFTASVTWSATAGTITQAGFFTAPSTAGPVTVKATSGSIVGSTIVSVVNFGPSIVSGPAATPSPVTATSTSLSVLGSDGAGESSIIYTWSTLGTPPAAVAFSANGTNAAKNATATFSAAGIYNFQVSLTDSAHLTTTATIQVVVQQTSTAVMVTPNLSSLISGQSEQFSATEFDQFNSVMAASFHWAASAGSIGNDGVFNAPAAGGSYTVTATGNGISGTATIMVGNSPPVITSPASASPNTISSGGSTTLSVSATDDGGANNLTYTWTDLTEPVNAVTPVFGGVNGSNAGQSTPVTLVTTGQYLFHVTITDLGGLVASGNTSVSVTSGQGGSTNASVATASSTAAGSNPSYAIDGNTSTAWTSAAGGNQWLEIDLGTVQTFSKVKITWGAQYASSYAIQVSTNGTTWKTEYYTTHGTSGTGGYAGITAQARYIRFSFYATPYTDYSIKEISIFS